MPVHHRVRQGTPLARAGCGAGRQHTRLYCPPPQDDEQPRHHPYSNHPTHRFPQCLSNDGDVRLYIAKFRHIVVDGQIAVVYRFEPCPASRHVSGRPHHQAIAHTFKQRGGSSSSGGGGGGGAGADGGGAAATGSHVLADAPHMEVLPPGKGGWALGFEGV